MAQTMDRRLPPVNVKGGLFNWAALKNPAFAVYCVSGVTIFLGLYTGGFDVFVLPFRHYFPCLGSVRCATNARRIVLTYIPISAIQVGIPNDFSFYFISIANGSSAFGRLSAGLLADRLGECRPASRTRRLSPLVLI